MAEIAAFRAVSAASALAEDVDTELELAFIAPSAASTVDDEFESARLEVWFVAILALTRFSELSTLEEEFESERPEV